jgi:hypothetical protein
MVNFAYIMSLKVALRRALKRSEVSNNNMLRTLISELKAYLV